MRASEAQSRIDTSSSDMGIDSEGEYDGSAGCEGDEKEPSGNGACGGDGKARIATKRSSGKTVRISSAPGFPPEYQQQQSFATDDIPTVKVRPQSYTRLEKEREAKNISVVMRKLSEEEEQLLKENAGEITLEDDYGILIVLLL